ncbi:hypothetical protein [Sphingomonas sp. RB1R13]|uniref:hypothetical protein n=1 Tax=Sphingomonas sp. RB1R13 TaxID=3096159 RepID=UPI002FC7E7B2
MNRREMLTGMAVAGATVALSTPTIAMKLPVSRAAWDDAMTALARVQAIRAAHEPRLEELGGAIQAGNEKHRVEWEAAFHQADKMDSAISAAEKVLLDMPAPDPQAVVWKVDRLWMPGEGIWSEGVEDQAYADLRRFLLGGRA